MFKKTFSHAQAIVVYALALALWLAIAACQPIQAPIQPAMDANPPNLTEPGRLPDGMTVAFVRDKALYIQQGDVAFAVEDCSSGCQVYYLTWSPDGKRLAYFYSPAKVEDRFQIRLANLAGQVQPVAAGVGWITPPAWSPHGDRLAYLVATDRYVMQEDVPRYIVEIWTTAVMANGTTANARMHGEVSIGGDCGGGDGRSESATIYETEGGLAYGGYQAGILVWTADDLILYSNNCSARGVGRFDITTDTELEPYVGKLGSLSLNRERDSWVAVDEQNRLVLGTPAALAYEPLVTKATPELAFYGQVTDDLFYTTLTVTGKADLVDEFSALEQSIPVSPYFEFTRPGLRSVSQSDGEVLLWEGDGYAYARIQQAADGALYFARVGDSKPLYTAVNEGTFTAETVEELRPVVDVMRLMPTSDKPEVWLANASQFTIAPVVTP